MITADERALICAKLNEGERMCLDGYLSSGNKTLAYKLSRIKESNANQSTLNTLAYKFFQKKEVINYLKMRRQDIKDGIFFNASKDDEVKLIAGSGAMGKLSTGFNDLKQMDGSEVPLEAIQDLTFKIAMDVSDPKIKADLLMKWYNLRGFKNGDNDTDKDKQIKYYVPLKCSSCELYIRASDKLNKKDSNNVSD